MRGKLRLGLFAGVLVLAVMQVNPASSASRQEAAPAPESADWVQISSGYYHTCGVRTTGRLYCWGQDSRGQLGDGGATTNVSAPTEVAGGATDWKSVSAGSAFTCAIKTTGRLYCWGRDDFGQVGNGPGVTGDQSAPVQVGAASDWKSVSAGLGETACGRRANTRIYCWGRDNNGQVGNGPASFDNVTVPAAVGTSDGWASVSTGGYHTCGRRAGRVYCWGDDLNGAVGDGGTSPGTDRPSPVEVAGAHADWTSVSAGITHSCGRRASGRVYCWGSDINGGLGNGGSNVSRYAPGQVSGNATDWKAVFAGGYVTCATKVSGRLYCWGYDAYGQVGTGLNDSVDNATPTQVVGGHIDWKTATIGNLHVCGRRATSRIYCWGYGFFGQRGDGQAGSGATMQPTPVEVL